MAKRATRPVSFFFDCPVAQFPAENRFLPEEVRTRRLTAINEHGRKPDVCGDHVVPFGNSADIGVAIVMVCRPRARAAHARGSKLLLALRPRFDARADLGACGRKQVFWIKETMVERRRSSQAGYF